MPITLPFATLAAGAIAGVATAFGAHESASANEDATKAQADYNNKALAAAVEQRDYQRQQQNQYLTRLAPYAATSAPALSRLTGLLDPSNVGLPSHPVPVSAPAALPAQTQANMVTLRAPNGQTKQVPSTQVSYYTSKGAQVVN